VFRTNILLIYESTVLAALDGIYPSMEVACVLYSVVILRIVVVTAAAIIIIIIIIIIKILRF